MENVVFIAFGSNLGNKEKNIKQALTLLSSNQAIKIIKISNFIKTKPVDGPQNQPDYLNGVIKIKTTYTPKKLLIFLQSIEKKLGRIRTIKNGPRTIDLDILLFNNKKIKTPTLTIPHPRMWQREFVTKPLKQIAPELFNNNNN